MRTARWSIVVIAAFALGCGGLLNGFVTVLTAAQCDEMQPLADGLSDADKQRADALIAQCRTIAFDGRGMSHPSFSEVFRYAVEDGTLTEADADIVRSRLDIATPRDLSCFRPGIDEDKNTRVRMKGAPLSFTTPPTFDGCGNLHFDIDADVGPIGSLLEISFDGKEWTEIQTCLPPGRARHSFTIERVYPLDGIWARTALDAPEYSIHQPLSFAYPPMDVHKRGDQISAALRLDDCLPGQYGVRIDYSTDGNPQQESWWPIEPGQTVQFTLPARADDPRVYITDVTGFKILTGDASEDGPITLTPN
ncbi:MAG: hypothetical protein AAFV53_32005 [Myxococcota bacterium]